MLAFAKRNDQDYYILGGGSNILCASFVNRVVIKNEILGIDTVYEDEEIIHLKIGGGENWHQLVLHTLDKGYGGLENLSLIPGTVGAAPVQNIGAYGVEQDQLFIKLEAVDLLKGEIVSFENADCAFSYRDSMFKSKYPGRYFITSVTYQLTKRHHKLNISYGAIEQELLKMKVEKVDIQSLSQAIINIRTFKLPDPSVVHNAGSFFKNPIIFKQQFDDLQAKFPALVFYKLDNEEYKIPAGWLIDQCGFKGMTVGNVGCYKNQALVIVNHGDASGEEVWQFAQTIQKKVMETYDILLLPEVNRWGLN